MSTTATEARSTIYPLIGGAADTTGGCGVVDVVNPATLEVTSHVVVADANQIDAAVSAAAEAQRSWWALSPARRGEILWAWADLLARHATELASLDTADIGKPIRDSQAEAAGLARTARYWAGMSDKILGEQIPLTPGHLSFTRREPLGVIGAVNAWNGPAASVTARIATATACGNGVVIKPSEWSPSSAGLVAELTVQAGMPAGLVNIIYGDGATGAQLVSHPGIGGVRFTGSVATGRKIAHGAADTFKKTVLELGGKSPNIVFADADIDAALRGSVWGVFSNSGQICCAGTRLLVERRIADDFVARLVDLARLVRVGDPRDSLTEMGTVSSVAQYERVHAYLEAGRAEGATVAVGGGRPDSIGDIGYYIAPTIFTGVEPGMRIATEEIFGPVLSVMTFETETEALNLANGVEQGLASIVWTRDLGRMMRMAEGIDAGTVWGNTARLMDPALPFEGFKTSGVGNSRAQGAIDGLTRLKRVSIRFDESAPHPGWDLSDGRG